MAEKTKTRYLRMRSDGFVYVWVETLAKRKDEFDECDANGILIKKEDTEQEADSEIESKSVMKRKRMSAKNGSVEKVNPADLPKT